MTIRREGGKTTTYAGTYFEKELVAVFVPSTMRSYGSQWRFDNTALPGGKTRKYYYFGGQRVAVHENNAAPQWIHGDQVGSASLTTDSAGVKAGEERYKPFGGSRVDVGDVRGNKRFQGSERVASIELDSMGARFYSAGLGRFVSADSIVPGAGNPQNFNRYSFVGNNPLKMTDPTGHAQIPIEHNEPRLPLLENQQLHTANEGMASPLSELNYANMLIAATYMIGTFLKSRDLPLASQNMFQFLIGIGESKAIPVSKILARSSSHRQLVDALKFQVDSIIKGKLSSSCSPSKRRYR